MRCTAGKIQSQDDLSKLFDDERTRQAEHERLLNELYRVICRLTTQLNWLKINLATSASMSFTLEEDGIGHQQVFR